MNVVGDERWVLLDVPKYYLTNELRWRTSRGQQSAPDQNQNPNQTRPFNQQRQAGRGNLADMPGNAWTNNDRGAREGPQQGPVQEQHMSHNGFKAQDARNLLRNGLFTMVFPCRDGLLTQK